MWWWWWWLSTLATDLLKTSQIPRWSTADHKSQPRTTWLRSVWWTCKSTRLNRAIQFIVRVGSDAPGSANRQSGRALSWKPLPGGTHYIGQWWELHYKRNILNPAVEVHSDLWGHHHQSAQSTFSVQFLLFSAKSAAVSLYEMWEKCLANPSHFRPSDANISEVVKLVCENLPSQTQTQH